MDDFYFGGIAAGIWYDSSTIGGGTGSIVTSKPTRMPLFRSYAHGPLRDDGQLAGQQRFIVASSLYQFNVVHMSGRIKVHWHSWKRSDSCHHAVNRIEELLINGLLQFADDDGGDVPHGTRIIGGGVLILFLYQTLSVVGRIGNARQRNARRVETE